MGGVGWILLTNGTNDIWMPIKNLKKLRNIKQGDSNGFKWFYGNEE